LAMREPVAMKNAAHATEINSSSRPRMALLLVG
jgi:hypothetical protein